MPKFSIKSTLSLFTENLQPHVIHFYINVSFDRF